MHQTILHAAIDTPARMSEVRDDRLCPVLQSVLIYSVLAHSREKKHSKTKQAKTTAKHFIFYCSTCQFLP